MQISYRLNANHGWPNKDLRNVNIIKKSICCEHMKSELEDYHVAITDYIVLGRCEAVTVHAVCYGGYDESVDVDLKFCPFCGSRIVLEEITE